MGPGCLRRPCSGTAGEANVQPLSWVAPRLEGLPRKVNMGSLQNFNVHASSHTIGSESYYYLDRYKMSRAETPGMGFMVSKAIRSLGNRVNVM